MNTSNFDWLDQLPTNESNGEMTLQSLGMESSDLATNDIGGEQDIVKYLFDTAQFSLPMIPVTSPPQSDNGTGSSNSTTDGDSPKSIATATMNNNNTTPAFDNSWLSSLNPQPTFTVFESIPVSQSSAPLPPKPKPKPTKESASRKMRIKKKREPIFVTESPQNAYKKRNKKSSASTSGATFSLTTIDEKEQHQQQQQQDSSSSPSSHFDDDDDDDVDLNESALDKQHLTSKERRQLRNKISARNFRVRRKEYISQLENKVDEQDDEIDALKLDNKRLTGLNEQLLQEVMELRLRLQQPQQPQQPQQQLPQAVAPPHYQQQPGLTVSPPSSSSSDSNSPPDFMEALLDFNLFNNTNINRNNTYLSHTLMPDFDLSHVLGDKLAHPPSSIQLEEQRELMTMYPLLAPTLASIVIRHTFTLHYFAYLSNAFPYDSSTAVSSKHDNILDIMHPEDWVTAATKRGDDGDPNNHGQDKLVPAHVVDRRRESSIKSSDNNDDEMWTREFEREVIQGHYAYYAMMRLRGLSHDEIMRRCQVCMERRKEVERQRRQKAATSCGKFQTLQAFTSVASALLRSPSRSPMIAEVIHETKACRMSSKKSKAHLMVSAPFRAALRIGNGKS